MTEKLATVKHCKPEKMKLITFKSYLIFWTLLQKFLVILFMKAWFQVLFG